jgi:hypothetical protein
MFPGNSVSFSACSSNLDVPFALPTDADAVAVGVFLVDTVAFVVAAVGGAFLAGADAGLFARVERGFFVTGAGLLDCTGVLGTTFTFSLVEATFSLAAAAAALAFAIEAAVGVYRRDDVIDEVGVLGRRDVVTGFDDASRGGLLVLLIDDPVCCGCSPCAEEPVCCGLRIDAFADGGDPTVLNRDEAGFASGFAAAPDVLFTGAALAGVPGAAGFFSTGLVVDDDILIRPTGFVADAEPFRITDPFRVGEVGLIFAKRSVVLSLASLFAPDGGMPSDAEVLTESCGCCWCV